MRSFFRGLGICALALALHGCIVKETTHRLYLSPDGRVAWTVLEERVRSTESDPGQRWREELAFVHGVAEKRHLMELGLKQLDPDTTSVRWLRSERPYTLLTEARFAQVGRLIQKIGDELRVQTQVTLQRTEDAMVLTVILDPSSLEQDGPDEETPVTQLIEDFDRYWLVLTDGTFLWAEGFEIFDDGSAARPRKPAEVGQREARRLEWRLAWSVR